jgi:FdhE protein
LRALAVNHPMREYLSFVAALAGAQQHAINDFPPLDLPDPAQLRANADRFGAPLAAIGWPRDPRWRDVLRGMLERLAPQLEARPLEPVIRLLGESDEFYELQADRLLGGVTLGLDLAAAPLIGAALQVVWVRLVTEAAQRFGRSIFDRPAPGPLCPCCGTRPTVSVVRIGGLESGYRYLHCALCSAQWHLVRIMCSHCLGTKGIHYEALDLVGSPASKTPRERAPIAAMRAECCDPCGHYLKILSMEKDPDLDPVADDLASIALDLLVSDAGKASAGINLMLLYGDPGDG